MLLREWSSWSSWLPYIFMSVLDDDNTIHINRNQCHCRDADCQIQSAFKAAWSDRDPRAAADPVRHQTIGSAIENTSLTLHSYSTTSTSSSLSSFVVNPNSTKVHVLEVLPPKIQDSDFPLIGSDRVQQSGLIRSICVGSRSATRNVLSPCR